MRKKVAYVYLPIVAMFPVLLGIYQVIHFFDWLLDLNIDFSLFFALTVYAPFLLILSFIISLYEKFCIYHRMCIISVLYTSNSYLLLDIFPNIFVYNIVNIIVIFITFVGIMGCLIHFHYQIKDFIRYVRTKR